MLYCLSFHRFYFAVPRIIFEQMQHSQYLLLLSRDKLVKTIAEHLSDFAKVQFWRVNELFTICLNFDQFSEVRL